MIRAALRFSFVRFCIVGATGFLINFVLLSLLYDALGWQLFVAQLVAGELALGNNFFLHHVWTYRESHVKKSLIQLLIEFHVTSWLAIVGTAAIVAAGVDVVHKPYLEALIVAGAVAMVWNFVWTRFVIWRRSAKHPADTLEDIDNSSPLVA